MPECFEMIDGGEHNPYHFLFYMLSNFLITNVYDEVVYYYPNKNNCKVSEGFLSLLPPNFTRHIVKQPGIVYRPFIDTIPIFVDTALPQSYYLVRDLYKAHISPMKKGKSIYIQRKPGQTRTFLNEADLRSKLELNGYETIVLEDHEIKEQIRIVSEAEYIIGAHGAGFAFTVFCSPGTKIIEICGKQNQESKHYYHIAHVLGYSFFRFQNVIENDDTNVLVNIKELVDFIRIWHERGLF